MKKTSLFLLMMAFCLTLFSCSSEELNKKNSDINSLNKENSELKLHSKELSGQIQLKEQEIKFLREMMDKNNQEFDKIKVQVKNLENLDKDFTVLKAQDQFNQEKIKNLTEDGKIRQKELQEKDLAFKKIEDGIFKSQEENRKIKEENERIKSELENFKKESLKVKENQEEKSKFIQDKQKAEQQLKEMESQLKGFQEKIASKEKEIAELKNLITELKKNQQEMEKESQKIKDAFQKEIKKGDMAVEHSYKRVKVMMMEQVLFRKSEISLTREGEKILKKVASLLKEIKDKEIFIIGHADSDPVKDPIIKKIFPTNWEFSVMRSVMVVRYLSELMGVNAGLLTAAGCSSYHPVVPETSEKNKSVNRRTEILIFPKFERIKESDKQEEENKKESK